MWGGYVYNRYIPNADGTFRKTVVTDAPPCPPKPPEPPFPPAVIEKPVCEKKPTANPLRRFLPAGIDTGDILVLLILLLLLIDGDEDDTLSVLLTAAAFILL